MFYNDFGNADYALLQNFDVHNFATDIADQIQLVGSAASYALSDISIGSIVGAGISYLGDLIGVVQGVNATDLSLANADHFTYV